MNFIAIIKITIFVVFVLLLPVYATLIATGIPRYLSSWFLDASFFGLLILIYIGWSRLTQRKLRSRIWGLVSFGVIAACAYLVPSLAVGVIVAGLTVLPILCIARYYRKHGLLSSVPDLLVGVLLFGVYHLLLKNGLAYWYYEMSTSERIPQALWDNAFSVSANATMLLLWLVPPIVVLLLTSDFQRAKAH